jgi:hypothetical protein
MGLRHRAALGISEVSDAIAVVVSEQSGSISISHAGRMIRRIDPERLENILAAFFRPDTTTPQRIRLQRYFPYLFRKETSMRCANLRTFLWRSRWAFRWVSAVSAADPNEAPIRTPSAEIVGQDPSLVNQEILCGAGHLARLLSLGSHPKR